MKFLLLVTLFVLMAESVSADDCCDCCCQNGSVNVEGMTQESWALVNVPDRKMPKNEMLATAENLPSFKPKL